MFISSSLSPSSSSFVAVVTGLDVLFRLIGVARVFLFCGREEEGGREEEEEEEDEEESEDWLSSDSISNFSLFFIFSYFYIRFR